MSKTSYNIKQTMVVVAQDALLLGELALSIYLGHTDPEQLSGIFLRTFIPLAAATVFASRYLIRRFGDAPTTEAPSGSA